MWYATCTCPRPEAVTRDIAARAPSFPPTRLRLLSIHLRTGITPRRGFRRVSDTVATVGTNATLTRQRRLREDVKAH